MGNAHLFVVSDAEKRRTAPTLVGRLPRSNSGSNGTKAANYASTPVLRMGNAHLFVVFDAEKRRTAPRMEILQ